jgi:hypothetical protein
MKKTLLIIGLAFAALPAFANLGETYQQSARRYAAQGYRNPVTNEITWQRQNNLTISGTFTSTSVYAHCEGIRYTQWGRSMENQEILTYISTNAHARYHETVCDSGREWVANDGSFSVRYQLVDSLDGTQTGYSLQICTPLGLEYAHDAWNRYLNSKNEPQHQPDQPVEQPQTSVEDERPKTNILYTGNDFAEKNSQLNFNSKLG